MSIMFTKKNNCEGCWHCWAWTMSCRSAEALLHRQASSVTEWLLQRQAEKWWVAVKVNKIKAGNLRVSVLHKQSHQQQVKGSVKDKGGWEDYRVCVDVCAFVGIGCWDPRLLCEQYVVTEWWGSFTVRVCSFHTVCSVNWLKAAGPLGELSHYWTHQPPSPVNLSFHFCHVQFMSINSISFS